jgi:clan AA aspartic protease (TIGR02281 family)
VRRILTLGLGILIGQWLAFGSATSPAEYVARAERAWRGADGLGPVPDLSHRILGDIARLTQATGSQTRETTVPLEQALGVWITRVVLDGAHTGRFLVDTGSSVTVVSPELAARVGIREGAGSPPIELQTLGGRTAGRQAIVGSLRVGDLERHDAPVVIHDPGQGVDGILGNTFLARYRITVDADRRELHLGLLTRD